MPLYQYRCEACGHLFEKLLSIENRDGVKCEKCAAPARRVYQGACAFGKKPGCASGGCGGNCQGCSGCAH